MTPEKLRQILPRASASVIALNAGEEAAKLQRATAEAQPKGRQPNKTEREYGRMLQAKHPEANVRFEAYTLKLAEGLRYTPDWAVEFPDGRLEFHECKGAFIFSKALSKPRAAAELFPQRFTLAQKLKTGWEITPLRGKIDAANKTALHCTDSGQG